ncbi:hypothetical protein E4191_10080 [Paracoccus liaowanqingii]|uniref:HNH endonuclease n=1 Tax=Paracoccus liaowanqingii TaxID=2560053 RepID=A0A4P7HLC3_9RHOB|nr:hypothetical protein [Paracoccus liaowanqingii]QBX35018.1 hypothetical protein E4191_10080 [Paracoccus liaowanqingii]
MKKIDRPKSSHSDLLQVACRNKKLKKTYPKLIKFYNRTERLARHYDNFGGNPNDIKATKLSADEKEAILYLYDKPPLGLPYLNSLRDSLSGETCPMCGGENPTTLDHYLTKQKYPEYALLAFNLVPACACNGDRGERLYNQATGARILHPYYDDCLLRPLVRILFDPGETPPKFTIDYLLSMHDPNYENLKYHVENIILRTNFMSFFSKNWFRVRDRPGDILAGYSKCMSTKMDFQNYLAGQHEASFGGQGPNSWRAIFFRSILNKNVSGWLYNRYHANGYI